MRLLTSCKSIQPGAQPIPAACAPRVPANRGHTHRPTLREAATTMKYVLVSGGVVSGLGKGVTASSVGVILKNCGHRVTSVKIGECLPRRIQCPA